MKKRFLQMVKKRVRSLRLFPLLVCLGFLIPTVGWGQAETPVGSWADNAASAFAGGTGTEDDPYQIATAEQLAKLSKDVSEGTSYQGNYFILTENIDLSAYRWVPIGIYKWMSNGTSIEESFRGFLDGNDMTISGMVVDERDDQYSAGFFGFIGHGQAGNIMGAKDLTISGATVYLSEDGLMECSGGILGGDIIGNENSMVVFENIRVSGFVEVNSTNGFNKIGGMLGYASWVKAINCHAENVSISGASNSGGFVGNDNGSVFENCTASGTVSGRWGLGGFVGYTTSTVLNEAVGVSTYTNCSADVDVSGNDWRVGGFVGYAEYGKFNNCVAYGNVDSSVDGWEPKVGGFMGECGSAIATNCHAAGTVTSASPDYEAGGFVGTYSGGTLTDCSFDIEKNPTLNAAGEGDLQGDGVTGEDSSTILANICEDYYGGHQYSTEWTVDTEATCTTSGSKSHHCERCGAKGDITEIPATGHDLTKTEAKEPTCTEDGNIEYWYCENCKKYFSDANATEEITDVVIPATGHHYVNGTCTECGQRDPDYRPDPDPISYYNIYVEEVCDGVEVTTSKNVVREGNSISVYVEKDTANYTFDNFKVYYKRSYYGTWEELPEGTQPGEYPIHNIWTHIYVKALGAEEKEAPTGIEQIEGVKVYTKDGSLFVQTPQREQVIIISMSGAVVKNEEQIGLKQYHGLNQGIYIVRIGNQVYKIRLH